MSGHVTSLWFQNGGRRNDGDRLHYSSVSCALDVDARDIMKTTGNTRRLFDKDFTVHICCIKTATDTGCFILSPCVGLHSVNPFNKRK